MCLIADASTFGDLLADPATEDAAPIHAWLERGGTLVYSTGGKFGIEVERSRNLKRRLEVYVRAGKARLIPHRRLAEDEASLSNRPDLRSNDPHVLALARESGTRLLFTRDAALMADFKNKTLIDRPRGKVYSGASNRSLLTRSVCKPPPTRN